MTRITLCLIAALTGAAAIAADAAKPSEKTAAERGWDAVRGRPPLNRGPVSPEGFETLWKFWGLKEKPADYAAAVRERYGVHASPYENGKLPMGLHETRGFVLGKAVTNDCLLCHAGSVAGQTIIGLGNSGLDLQGLLEDLFAAGGMSATVPFRFSYVRGTIDPVSSALFLMAMRDADMNIAERVELDRPKDGICSDPPAWWQLKKKKIRDWNGGVDVRSTRLDMINILGPLNSGAFVRKQESVYADIHAFVMSVPAPKYPFPVDAKQSARGEALFVKHCASCHGTYGEKWTYPNKVVELHKIGTDPLLATSFTQKNLDHLNKSWLNQEKGADGKPYQVMDTGGYQAPPLDGVWATAPYFHNGSVPTVYHVLNSKARPKYHTRSYGTGKEDYDPEKLGLKFTVLKEQPDAKLSRFELRKIYDTTQPGRANTGHTFGDDLTEDERMAVIEYLKTL